MTIRAVGYKELVVPKRRIEYKIVGIQKRYAGP